MSHISIHCIFRLDALALSVIVWGVVFRGIGGVEVVIDALVLTSWVMPTSGIYWLAMSGMCLVAPETSSSVSAGICTSGRNSISGLNSTSGSSFIPRPPLARDLVTMAEDGLHLDGSRRVSLRWPGPPELNPTCRIGRCNLPYCLDLGPFLEPAIIGKLLTNLRKFAQPAEARKWLFTVTANSKTLIYYEEMKEFTVGT